jgi:uncharacterized protein (DUF1330 family)
MINRQITGGLAMVVSAALGAAVVQTLHAQAKPPAYNVAEITIKDQDGYNKEYLPVITKALTDAGGKFIVRGGKAISYEGAAPAPRVVVVQFENLDKLQALYNSASIRTPSQLAISTLRSGSSASKGSRRSIPPHPIRYAAPTRRSQRGLNNDCARRCACGQIGSGT